MCRCRNFIFQRKVSAYEEIRGLRRTAGLRQRKQSSTASIKQPKLSAVSMYFAHNKRWDAHWAEPHLHCCESVSSLHSGLQRVRGRDKHSLTDYVLKASRDLGLAPWTQQLKSGLPRYLADSAACVDLKPARTQTGSRDWAVRRSVFLLQMEHRLHRRPDGNMLYFMFTVWVFIQIYTAKLNPMRTL